MTLFYEKQRFPLIWNLIICLVTVPAAAYLIYSEISRGATIWTIPYSVWLSLVLLVIALIFINMIYLETRMDKNGIGVRFYPLHFQEKYYAWDEITSAEIRKYRPILEYGGWGWRKSLRNGTAYNIKGNIGLQLNFKDGKKLLIGTQDPDQLQVVLDQIQRNVRRS